MTKDEARKILNESRKGNWINMGDNGDPEWHESIGGITLDGEFSREELFTILAFHPES